MLALRVLLPPRRPRATCGAFPRICVAFSPAQTFTLNAACLVPALGHAKRRASRFFRHPALLTWCISQVVIALGSNQGDRAELLRAAVRALPRAGVDVAVYSSLYETAPAYVTDQARTGRCTARGKSSAR